MTTPLRRHPNQLNDPHPMYCHSDCRHPNWPPVCPDTPTTISNPACIITLVQVSLQLIPHAPSAYFSPMSFTTPKRACCATPIEITSIYLSSYISIMYFTPSQYYLVTSLPPCRYLCSIRSSCDVIPIGLQTCLDSRDAQISSSSTTGINHCPTAINITEYHKK